MTSETINKATLGVETFNAFIGLLERRTGAVTELRTTCSPQIAALCCVAAGYQKRGINWNPPIEPIDRKKAMHVLQGLLGTSPYTQAHIRQRAATQRATQKTADIHGEI